jgi:hypothetical protein
VAEFIEAQQPFRLFFPLVRRKKIRYLVVTNLFHMIDIYYLWQRIKNPV